MVSFIPLTPASRETASRGSYEMVELAASIVIAAGVISFLYFGQEILIPLTLASILSFVLWPIIRFFRKLKFGRVISILATVALALLALIALGSAMGLQLTQLANDLPRYEANLREKVKSLKGASVPSGAMERAADALQGLQDEMKKPDAERAGEPPSAVKPKILSPQQTIQSGTNSNPVVVELRERTNPALQTYELLVKPIMSPLITTALVVLFLVFILMQREDLRDRVLKLVGGADLQRSTMAMNDAGERLSRYFLAQLTLNTCFGIFIGTGLAIIGVPSPVLWGVLAALMRFVPYVGSFVAAFLPVVLAAAVDPSWTMVVQTAALFLICEPVAGQIIEPLLYGQNTGISALAVVASALFWTTLWGPIGLLLATPLTVCLVVLGKHVPALNFLTVILGDEPALAPDQRLYQRLLAGDVADATTLAEEELKKISLIDYYDGVFKGALRLAYLDAAAGKLPILAQSETLSTVEQVVDELAQSGELKDAAAKSMDKGETAPLVLNDENPPQPRPVFCIATRSPLDQAMCLVVAEGIKLKGIPVRVASSADLTTIDVEDLKVPGATVLLSYFGEETMSSARFLIRRLRRVAPDVKIVAGFWMLNSPDSLNMWRESSGADFATASVKQCIAFCTGAYAPPSEARPPELQLESKADNTKNKMKAHVQ